MRIVITRTGGFAGMTQRHEVDPAPPAVETLARAAEKETPSGDAATPDAFEYAVSIDGREYVVKNPTRAWGRLIEAVLGK